RGGKLTIAVCYVSPEGIVLGADSTTTFQFGGVPHFYNNAQKIFEIGENSTYGIACWGLGGFGNVSYRTLVARLADDLAGRAPVDVEDVATRWAGLVYQAYNNSLHPVLDRY